MGTLDDVGPVVFNEFFLHQFLDLGDGLGRYEKSKSSRVVDDGGVW